jgi:hypothetical protein
MWYCKKEEKMNEKKCGKIKYNLWDLKEWKKWIGRRERLVYVE